MIGAGETNVERIRTAVEEILIQRGNGQIEYVALADPHTLQPVDRITGRPLSTVCRTRSWSVRQADAIL